MLDSTVQFLDNTWDLLTFKYNRDERLARRIVRQHFGSDVLFKTESNGTVRFDVRKPSKYIGYDQLAQGFYRVRKNKVRPLSGDNIDSFDQIHFGKITIGIESKKGRSVWNFSANAL